jgi:CrcB protein
MIKDFILVGIGSGIGGICRYLMSVIIGHAHNGFPWGTFTANIAGCLFIGILWGVTNRYPNMSQAFTLMLMVGFCGGFTTFSTFSKEGLAMLQSNNYIPFLIYTLGSVTLGLMAVGLGYVVTK